LNTKEIGHVFRQTFTVSVGIANEEGAGEIPASTRIAGGIKFSIIRPHFDKTTIDGINAIEADQATLIANIAETNNADATRNLLENMRDEVLDLIKKNTLESKKTIELLANDREKNEVVIDSIVKDSLENEADLDRKLIEINRLIRLRIAEIEKEDREKNEAWQIALEQKIRKNAEDLKFNRAGWFLDFAGGTVLGFKEQTFNKSYVSKSGAWLTGGYDAKKSLDFLAIARYLYQPDKILADDTALLDSKNISTFDSGLRLIYKEMKKQKLSISTEALYRSVLNEKEINPSWRVVLNTTYDLGENQVLSFAFGKDFDNTLIKEDNLIASLNYIIGLGSKRLIKKLATPSP
jgi:hypothetical protein